MTDKGEYMKLYTKHLTESDLIPLAHAMGLTFGQSSYSGPQIDDDGLRVKGRFTGKRCYKFVLRPMYERGELRNDYRRNSQHHPNGTFAASWAGHYVFMRAVLDMDNSAVIISGRDVAAEWTYLSFAREAWESGGTNVGSMMNPYWYMEAQSPDHVAWEDEADLIELATCVRERAGLMPDRLRADDIGPWCGENQ